MSDHETWPSLRIEFELCPWVWRLRPWFYRDEVDPTFIIVHWLGVRVTFGCNHPVFRWGDDVV